MKHLLLFTISLILLSSCIQNAGEKDDKNAFPTGKELIHISREQYQDQLYGFWLGQCIANWTGLMNEMDKIGNVGVIKTGGTQRLKVSIS